MPGQIMIEDSSSSWEGPLKSDLTPRESILANLRGSTIKVPDLDQYFAAWPVRINSHWPRLTESVNKKLAELIQHPIKRLKLQGADFALFACAWWPTAEFEQLETLVFLAIWLFVWDDEIDESTGSLTNDFNGAQDYRANTIAFVRSSLKLDQVEGQVQPLRPVIGSFKPIGDALCKQYDHTQLEIFFEEMVFFMDESQTEQAIRLSGRVPSIIEYWNCRLGTSAVGVCLAAIEYGSQLSLPHGVARLESMKALWEETNNIIWITNDLLSIKKEVALGCIDSLIPLLCATGNSPQEAVDEGVALLRKSIDRFESSANEIMSELSNNEERQRVSSFVDCCRMNCTGNLFWSLRTKRYGLGLVERDEDGAIQFTL